MFVDDYADITSVLEIIVNRFRRRTVLVSGSADEFGPWGRSATEGFLVKLGSARIQKDFRSASGFGLGIGGAIVTGATQEIYSSKIGSIEEQLILRPFPIGITDPVERERVFDQYRREMLGQAGITIFIMGNKYASGSVVNADGMKSEFRLAQKMGLYLIPVGASGFMAKELWDEVNDKIDHYFPQANRSIKSLIQKTGSLSGKPDDLIEPLMKFVELLTKK